MKGVRLLAGSDSEMRQRNPMAFSLGTAFVWWEVCSAILLLFWGVVTVILLIFWRSGVKVILLIVWLPVKAISSFWAVVKAICYGNSESETENARTVSAPETEI